MQKEKQKIFTLIVLAAVTIMSCVTPQLCISSVAATDTATVSGETAFVSNQATTTVKAKLGDAAAANLAATIPLSVTLAVKTDGKIVGPTIGTCRLINTGSVGFYVSNINAAYEPGYSYNSVAGTDTVEISISNIAANGNRYNQVPLRNGKLAIDQKNWHVSCHDDIYIAYDGSIGNFSKDISSEIKIMTLTFTLTPGIK